MEYILRFFINGEHEEDEQLRVSSNVKPIVPRIGESVFFDYYESRFKVVDVQYSYPSSKCSASCEHLMLIDIFIVEV